MELLAPAGSLEKLNVAYTYGADAAYIGVQGFSLRSRANSIEQQVREDPTALAERLAEIKGGRRLYSTLNIYLHNADLRELPQTLQTLEQLPIDAVIVSDLGILDYLDTYLPDVERHLSTQANCTNTSAARLYHRLGFSRIIPGRELSLREIQEIKQAIPELELEVFAHGAVCMAYSGRCFLSAFATGRSGNRGDCAQSCRWNYKLVEEKRPGEYLPVEEDGRFLSILSARDINLLDHLHELESAGADSIKIEGRAKSAYYLAMVTRAYRSELDHLKAIGAPGNGSAGSGNLTPGQQRARRDLEEMPHREYSPGFLLDDSAVHEPTLVERDVSVGRLYRLMAIVGGPPTELGYPIIVKNRIETGQPLEYILPDGTNRVDTEFQLFGEDGQAIPAAYHPYPAYLKTETSLPQFAVIRNAN